MLGFMGWGCELGFMVRFRVHELGLGLGLGSKCNYNCRGVKVTTSKERI